MDDSVENNSSPVGGAIAPGDDIKKNLLNEDDIQQIIIDVFKETGHKIGKDDPVLAVAAANQLFIEKLSKIIKLDLDSSYGSLIESISKSESNHLDTIKSLDESIKQSVREIVIELDNKLQAGVNNFINAAELTQKHTEELQKQSTENLTADLQKTHIEFICAAKESIDSIFRPSIESMENLIKKASSTGGGSKSSKISIIAIGIIGLLVGGFGGIFYSENEASATISDLKTNVMIAETAYYKAAQDVLTPVQMKKYDEALSKNIGLELEKHYKSRYINDSEK